MKDGRLLTTSSQAVHLGGQLYRTSQALWSSGFHFSVPHFCVASLDSWCFRSKSGAWRVYILNKLMEVTSAQHFQRLGASVEMITLNYACISHNSLQALSPSSGSLKTETTLPDGDGYPQFAGDGIEVN